ncbi:MAG: hypothetical protein FJY77_00185 [Candidatus Altiarchaeales archaeon]|nr:hypothetical protein [Candidatus Altiarchaeales archaeon]
MKHISPITYIVALYIVVMALGLHVGSALIPMIYETGEIPPAVPDPESLGSSAQIFLYILVMTGFLLLLIKMKKDFIIKAIAYLALFVGVYLTLFAITPKFGLPIAVLLLALTTWKKQNLLFVNLTLILTVSGVGAFLGASLSALPSLLLLVVLSVYDLIAVFYTKHMVTLAEKAKGKLPFMFLIPVGGRNLGLGTGDLAIPLVFTVSVYKDYALANAIATAAGGLMGIILLFQYVKNRRNITLPALPPIMLGLIAGLAISMLPKLF